MDATVSVRVEVPDPGAAIVAGLNAAVTPEGWPVAVSTTASSKPPFTAVVIVDVPLPPSTTVTETGDAVTVKPVLATVRLTVAVCVNPPPVPVTVIGYVPPAGLLPAVNVRVEDPDPGAGMAAGLKPAVTPEGRPPADNEIAELKVPDIADVMVDCAEPSAAMVKAVGLADNEKPGAPLEVIVRLAPPVDVTPPPLPVMVKE